MPFIPNTPESLLARSDSKNPDGTCRGVTGGGRPCRRPLAATPGSTTPQNTPPRKKRTAADRLRVDDPTNPDLYCWQHKDQAESSARSSPGPGRPSTAGGNNGRPILETRESIDTLVDRLGIVEAQQKKQHQQHHGKQSHHGSSNNNNNNHNHNNGGGRKPSGQGRPGGEKTDHISHQQHSSSESLKPKKSTLSSLLCCCFKFPIMEEEWEDQQEQEQHQHQHQHQQPHQSEQSQHHQQLPTRPKPRPVQSAPATAGATAKLPSSSSGGPKKTSNSTGGSGQSSNLLSLIPATTAPQTASQLLAELAKPPSAQDEAGYIYIFWLTPETAGAKPPTDAARSLLSGSGSGSGSTGPTPPSSLDKHLRPTDGARQRRPSDVVASYTSANSKGTTKQQQQLQQQQKGGPLGNKTKSDNKNTLLLKIGRASNVQRRLNEWTRQCGYDIDLIRYYPYVPSNPSASAPPSRSSSRPATASSNSNDGPRKTPHSHKVERLVHIELQGLGLRALDGGACASCGRTHREWFEVEASRGGIGVVDEVVRRWCDWDEGRL